MARSDPHIAGYRWASKDAVTWLHDRADQMNDPMARAVLNAAADHLGAQLKVNAVKMGAEPPK